MIENKINQLIEKIREILAQSSNPLFFFDNDVDGLASFLLLRKCGGKGKAVAIKSFPELSMGYIRKINELFPDAIFVLDKPKIAKGFFDYVKNHNYRFVWIDHHQQEELLKYFDQKNFILFNPTMLIGINKPTTLWAYKICNEPKNYDWIAALGSIADWHVPNFIGKFYEKYKDLFEISKDSLNNAGKILYETTFGKIIMILNFGLKDTTTNIVKMTKFLIDVESPYKILEENEKNKPMHKRFKQIYKKYLKLVKKAEAFARHDVLFFQYGGNLSISSEISNELLYRYPKKIVVVAYLKGDRAKVSIRSSYKIRDLVIKAIKDLEDATAGGHENALGANLAIEDLPKFKDNLIKLWREEKKKLRDE